MLTSKRFENLYLCHILSQPKINLAVVKCAIYHMQMYLSGFMCLPSPLPPLFSFLFCSTLILVSGNLSAITWTNKCETRPSTNLLPLLKSLTKAVCNAMLGNRTLRRIPSAQHQSGGDPTRGRPGPMAISLPVNFTNLSVASPFVWPTRLMVHLFSRSRSFSLDHCNDNEPVTAQCRVCAAVTSKQKPKKIFIQLLHELQTTKD